MPTIAVACLNDAVYRRDNPGLNSISARNKIEYCLAHDYSLHLVTHSLADERKGSWSKLPLLQTLLQLHEWVFWADTDCLFLNHNIRLEDLIDENFSLVITRDMNGLSNGNFLIKRGEWASEFLMKAWARTDCFDHWGQEQLAMELTLKENPEMEKQVKYVQQNDLCSYYDVKLPKSYRAFKSGDFIVHFPGHYGRSSLLTLMQDFSSRVIVREEASGPEPTRRRSGPSGARRRR